MSTVAATELAPALAASMEAQAINHAEALELYNPDPECNSALERTIATHREYGIPAERTREDLTYIVRALKTNSVGLEILASVTGDLDRFSRRAHNAGTRSTMTVREVMDATRPALAMLREQDVSDEIVRAVFALARVFACVDEIKPSLAAQLGAGPYAQLLAGPRTVGRRRGRAGVMLLLAAAALLFGWWLRGAADEPIDPTGLYGDRLEDVR